MNIKCPNCGVTAMRLHEGIPSPRWQVEPLRTIGGDMRTPEAPDA